ncbi:MAG: hypothetical protein IJO73_01880 [Clostridia bacterium]|nr:hypothetical protein [Clostridia bacterium]
MNKPRRIISIFLTAVMMLTFAVAAVAADDETDLKDVRKIISISEYK